MGVSIAFFESVADCGRYVDQQIVEAKRLLMSYTKQVEEVRVRYESAPKAEANLKSRASRPSLRQAEVAGFKVLTNPTPLYELNILDEVVGFTQDRIDALERTKNELLPTLQDKRKIAVISYDGTPEAFMCY
jgi:hypothetical protein